MQIAVTMDPTQTFPLGVTQVDSSGTPLATQDPTYGGPAYTVSDDTILTLQPNPGLNPAPVTVVPTGKLGTAVVTATEISSDSEPQLIGTLVVTVVGPPAAGLKFTGSVQGS